MAIQKTVTLYKFEELSKEDQKKVIDKNRDINVNYDWWNCAYDDKTEDLNNIGFSNIKINFSGFHSQGDGASFIADTVDIEKVLRHYKKWSKYRLLHEMIRFREIDGSVKRSPSIYCHENTVYFNMSDIYYNISSKKYDLIQELEQDLTDIVRELCQEIYQYLNDDYDYLTSDEYIKDTLIANEYYFNSETLEIDS